MFWLGTTFTLSSCQKERLFTHVDSIAPVPSQFHFFNSFPYDSVLTLSVDGLPRQNVKAGTISQYYSSSSAFNLNALQPNSKLLAAYDPMNNALFSTQAALQFKPQTSYLVFETISGTYDTTYYPKSKLAARLNYLPEDLHHPFDGSTNIRFINLANGTTQASLTMSPNVGTGTSLSLQDVQSTYSTPLTIVNASDTYKSTQPGVKYFTLTLAGSGYSISYNAVFKYLPVQLDNSKVYTLIAVGDMKNYLAGLEAQPKLYLMEDDNAASLQQLKLSSLTYPANATTTASVNVVDGAYNLPGVINYTDPLGNLTQFYNTSIYFNQQSTSVYRWPILHSLGGVAEDVGDASDLTPPSKLFGRISGNITLQPNSYFMRVLYSGSFSPTITTYNYNFQQGLNYTVCLVPNQNSTTACGVLVLQNDNLPASTFFKLRVINLMGGVPAIDVHLNSASGPILAASVPFNQPNAYATLAPNFVAQNLYITAAGSTTPLFQTGTKNTPIQLVFKAGNSGTLYLMGLLPGGPYTGDGSAYSPFVYYNNDAYTNFNSVNSNQILFY